MTDWEHSDELREAILAELVAELPQPPQPGDFTLAQFMQVTGYTRPRANYQLDTMVAAGRLETQMCDIGGRAVRVWRKPCV